MFKAGFFQFNPKFGEVQGNLETVLSALDNIVADLVVLPELAFTGYFFESRAELEGLAEDPADSSTVESLITLCKSRQLYLVTEFQHKMEKYRQEMDVKVDDLESRLEKMTGDSEKQLRGFIQSLKEKNREMSDKAKQIIGSAKQELTRQLEKTITGLEKKINDLQKQSENMGKDGREKLSRQLEVLRKKNRETMDKLERFKTEGVKTWDEIKSLIFRLWQDLKNAYDRDAKEPEVKKI